MARPQAEHRHRRGHGAHRPGRPQQAALRRLHRARRHRADVPRLRRQRATRRRATSSWSSRAARRRSASTRIRFDGLAHEDDRQKQMVTGEVTALRGRQGDRPAAARRSGSSASTRASRPPRWRSGARPAEDLYIMLGNYDLAEGNVDAAGGGQPARRLDLVRLQLLAIGTGIAPCPSPRAWVDVELSRIRSSSKSRSCPSFGGTNAESEGYRADMAGNRGHCRGSADTRFVAD